MSRLNGLQILAVALCTAAAFISSKLLAKHMTGSSGSAWFEAGCIADAETGNTDCAAVLASPYSYWPPKKPGEPKNVPHIPVAFLGLVHFSTLAVWLVGVGSPSRARRWIHLVPLVWVLCGLLLSARFTYIMFTRLDEWCPWCMATHVLNLLTAICVALLWPRKARGVAGTHDAIARQEGGGVSTTEDVRPRVSSACRPTLTRVLGTVGAMFVVAYGDYGQSGLLRVKQVERTLRQYEQALVRIQGDVPRLMKNWKLAKEQPITIRPDDPARTGAGPGQTTVDVIVFSDFMCPSCARFAPFLEDKVQPLFDHRLKVVFKHYPIDRRCNKHVSATLHPSACEAARVAEAARIQGGNDAFWRAHDLLFAQRASAAVAGRLNVYRIASELGLDPVRLADDMRSAAVTNRIQEDTVLATRCAVRGTPAVFVRRKRVDQLAVKALAFWDALADQFWKETGESRPASAELPGRVTTRDSQGPTDGP